MTKNKRSAEEVELWLEYGLDIKNRVIDFDSDIDDVSVGVLNRSILTLEKLSNEPIDIYINSGGGYVTSTFCAYDTIKNSSCHIRTIARGNVCSGATVLFLAGDERVAYPTTAFMFHISSGFTNGKLFEAIDDVEESKRQYDMLCGIYAERTKYKNKKWWKTWLTYRDRWLNVPQAKELGIIEHEWGVDNGSK
jgi:ATP-dependent Clp protease, protease subunit